MDLIFKDLRYAFRLLIKKPSSTLIAVVAMALGIGLTASMYAILEGVLLRGLPFEGAERLVHVENNNLERGFESMEMTQHDFEDYRAQQKSFTDLAGWTDGTFNLSDENVPARFNGAWVSSGFLDIVKVEPVVGRGFTLDDEAPGAPQVLLLSYHVWQNRYGGDREIVGQTVRVNSRPTTVLGVLPEDFRFPINHDLWMPLQLETATVARGEGNTLEVFGRLAEGATLEGAANELATIAKRLEEQYPELNEGVGVVLKPYIDEYIDGDTKLMLGVMFTAVVLVLLIACFNVTNLLLGRAAVRGRELAIRSALGSSRFRVISQVLSEALLIALLGAVVGVALAHWAMRIFDAAIAQTDPPFWMSFYISQEVMLFTVLITVVAALAAGFLPALQSSRGDVSQVLTDTTRGSTSLRMGFLSRSLVTIEVALSCALLVGAGLMVRSVLRIHDYDLKFEPENVLTARLGLFEGDHPTEDDWIAFFDDLTLRLQGRSEVASVALGTVVPTETDIGAGGGRYERVGEVYDRPQDRPWARQISITPGYWETFGVELLAGRNFTVADRKDSAPVAIVNQDFARKEWPGENPIGQRVRLWSPALEESDDPEAGWVEVVGVAPDLRFADFDNADDQQAIYLPLAQRPQRFTWIITKTRNEPVAFAGALRQAVLELDPNLPLYYVRSMDQVLSRTMFFPNLFGVLFSIFGGVAVILAAVGLYGVMAFGVTQRTQEMGVRMALGARGVDVLGLVLRQGLKQVGVGLALGLLLAVGLAFSLASFLFQVEAVDPVTFVFVPAFLLMVALLACFVPGRRAAGADPLMALRYE